jgi:hypothetical protein
MRGLGWTFESERVTIRKFNEIRDYLHYHVADVVPIELTVYEPRELRFRPKSSTDGKPIVRMRASAVEGILMRDHPEEWGKYVADGTVEGMADLLAEEDEGAGRPGAFDGLLELAETEPSEGESEWLEASEENEDDDEEYDPLPGFEAFG